MFEWRQGQTGRRKHWIEWDHPPYKPGFGRHIGWTQYKNFSHVVIHPTPWFPEEAYAMRDRLEKSGLGEWCHEMFSRHEDKMHKKAWLQTGGVIAWSHCPNEVMEHVVDSARIVICQMLPDVIRGDTVDAAERWYRSREVDGK